MKKSQQKTEIKGVVFFDLLKFDDERGWLIELFRNDCLESINFPSMAYISQTKPNETRGPHEHEFQSDLFCFVGPGDFELVLWEKSLSTLPYEERHLVGESNPVAVIIPPGVVHAYKNLSNYPGVVFNAPNKLYGGPGKCYKVDEIRHEQDKSSCFII
jgi:dTDP-4-dehydrorhamnose 3,5-epimerase